MTFRRILNFVALLLAVAALAQTPAADQRETEFRGLARQLITQRLTGGTESEEPQEKALSLLDSIVLEHLNRPGGTELAPLNQRLARLVSQQPPVGENFEVIQLAAPHAGSGYYALVANFSQSGPSAVRLYAPASGGFRLGGRIDRFRQTEFFDEFLEVVPIRASDLVFVTVTGRVDEMKTGSFAAWRLRGEQLEMVWSVDVLEHSTYDYKPDGFHLQYCSQPEEQNPRRCQKFTRERYVWNGMEWRRVEQTEVNPPK